MAFSQGSSQQDHIGLRKALVDVVGDGDVCGDDGDARLDAQRAHEFERGGAGVYDQGVAVVDEIEGRTGDGLFGLDVYVQASVLNGDGERAVERDGPAVRAAQLSVGRKGVEVSARGDHRYAKGACQVCDLHRCRGFEHGENGAAALFCKRMRTGRHGAPLVNVQILFCFILLLRKRRAFLWLSFCIKESGRGRRGLRERAECSARPAFRRHGACVCFLAAHCLGNRLLRR